LRNHPRGSFGFSAFLLDLSGLMKTPRNNDAKIRKLTQNCPVSQEVGFVMIRQHLAGTTVFSAITLVLPGAS
jgi:hypothetical protein